VFVALAAALRRFEPGFRLTRIVPERLGADGAAVLMLSGTYYPRGHLGDMSLAEDRDASVLRDRVGIWRPVAGAVAGAVG
jgi:hypothetical protein